MVDESTLNQSHLVKANILIATNQVQTIEGHVELIVEKVNYNVRIFEEESFRSIDSSLFPISPELAMDLNTQKDDGNVVTPFNQVDVNSEEVAKNGTQVVEVEKQTEVNTVKLEFILLKWKTWQPIN